MTEVDTVALNFQNMNMEEGMTGHYSILGNMGSPRLSHVFADRQFDTAPTIFLQPLTGFYKRSDQMIFTNSNIPYTNLSYWPNGNKITGVVGPLEVAFTNEVCGSVEQIRTVLVKSFGMILSKLEIHLALAVRPGVERVK